MILGLTGPICAGTDTFADILKKEKGFIWFSYSDILREEAKKRNIELARTNLQDLGDELRKTHGPGILSKILAEKILQDPEKDYIVGNIRNPGEVEEMRRTFQDKFRLIMITASQEIRFDRLSQRRREKDPQTFEEFKKLESRDFGENQPMHAQQHAAVFPLADLTIENNGTIEELSKKIRKLFDKIDG